MVFNFGEAAFKHPPSAGFVAICKAQAANTATGQAKAAGQQTFKPKNNAPQAIILEVQRFLN